MKKEQVLLLHGIAMAPHRMLTLAAYLRWQGYDVLNIGYPSRKMGVTQCADYVAERIKDHAPAHAIVHSMGELVLLDMLMRDLPLTLRRAVFMGTPFGGSEVADILAPYRLYQFYFGPAGQELTTRHRRTLIEGYRPLAREIGVISGTRAWEHPWFMNVMKPHGPHDSLVSVASTHIPGMVDQVTLNMPHGMLIEFGGPQALHFLKTGRFRKPPADAAP